MSAASGGLEPEDQAVFDRLKSTGRITHGLRRLMTQQWSVCSVCDHLIFPGRPGFAGYDAAGQPVYVGACCAREHLTELASPIWWRNTLKLSVPDEQVLWRYMDFAKFAAMLRQRGLYFPRADTLEDRFEGALGVASREAAWDARYLDAFRKAVAHPRAGEAPPSPEDAEAEARELLRSWKQSSLRDRMKFVSCWHANSLESEALWRLYCSANTPGVAVRTTVGALWDATRDEPSAVVGRVHYLDFRQSYALSDQRIFCKRASLRHEQEVRAVLANGPDGDAAGRVVACDLADLIDEVVISPFAPAWFEPLLADVIEKFGFRLDVRPSELCEEPFY